MKKILLFFLLLLTMHLVSATILQGTVYDASLEVASDVLIEIDTTPAQKYLTKDGTYSFELSQGKYILMARKGFVTAVETIEIETDGTFTYDLFLLPSFVDEDDLWQDTTEDFFSEDEEIISDNDYEWWRYLIAGIIIVYGIFRLIKYRLKYGPLRLFRRKVKIDSRKSVEQHKKELDQEPEQIDNALEIIKKHDGRISQKQLRKEMLYLSEAKVSLIVTELQHKGKIEKVKKGRGNVLIFKGD